MKRYPWAKTAFSCAFALVSATAVATDYYVSAASGASDDNDGLSAEFPFATVDKAIASAANASDVIHVAAGTYATTAQWGPNLKAKLIGTGASRDDVVIESAGTYRTLRMAAGSWLENVTVVGNTDISKADKGGAIEMNGGTVTNCVVRDGTAKGNDSKNAGGNLYVNSDGALVVDCVISGGTAKNRGGNVCLDHGTLRNCTITGGTASDGSENNGGNVWTYQGKIENCAISGGSAVLGGNVFIYNTNASLIGGTITGGTATQYGGNVYLRQGSMSDATVTGGSTTTTSGNYGGGNIYADGNAVVSECVILGGSAFRRGGNVYAVGGATVKDCAITNGVCSANIGGNIYMEAATVTNSTVYGGSAPAGRGGNIFLNNAASLVTDCTIENGNAGTQGGNVYVNSGSVSGSTIANGTSVTEGGNVFMAASTVVSDCVISNGTINSTNTNWDGPKGVNVNLNGASAKLLRCHVIGGTTTPLKEDGSFYYDRGSVAVNNASAQIDNCLVEGCACGGVVMQSNGYLYSSTVVNNGKYGYWSWNANQHVYNTVIYGNMANDANADWTGNMPDGASAVFLNNAVTESGSRHTTDAYPTVVLLASDSAFAGYVNGDYRPADYSALIDAGADDSRGAAASSTDLAGNPRQNGVAIDIGCYEYQTPDMSVHIDGATLDQAFAPAVVTFTHSVDHSADPATVVFSYDFGDGTTNETTAAATISHTYTTPGAYTVTITASNDCEDESAEMTYPGYVRVASPTVYVTPGTGSGTFPYNTPESGFATIKAAVDNAIDGNTLLLGAGIYETGNELVVDKSIAILGTAAKPEEVIVRNTNASQGHRTMAVNNGDAFVANLTIENGYNNIGANLRLAAGVVSNCVIRGGTAVANSNGAGSGVELAGAGTLTHCVVSNNVVQGTSSDGGMTGGAIYIPYNSKNGRISNCLVAYNRYVTSGETVKAGTAGIRFFGENNETKVENCTIVANTVEGTLSDDSAGIYCTSWSVRFRNNIIAGNNETGKGRFTAAKIDEHCTNVNNLTDAEAPATAVFRNFSGGDFRLKSGSAAYDKGASSGLTLQPSVDLAGKPRIYGKAIDIGCYECQSLPRTMIIMR